MKRIALILIIALFVSCKSHQHRTKPVKASHYKLQMHGSAGATPENPLFWYYVFGKM